MFPENSKLYTGFEGSLPWQSVACDYSCLKSSLHLDVQQNEAGCAWCIIKPTNRKKTPKTTKEERKQPNFAVASLKHLICQLLLQKIWLVCLEETATCSSGPVVHDTRKAACVRPGPYWSHLQWHMKMGGEERKSAYAFVIFPSLQRCK